MEEQEYKQMLRQSFDAASAGYDSTAMRFFDNSAQHLLEILPLSGKEKILDVAAGTGKSANLLAKALPEGEVIGIDLSEGMLRQAEIKAKAEHLKNVFFHCMDVDALNFSENSFDGACCSFGAFFFPDMKKSLMKILRVIRPGGYIAITSFLDGSFTPLSDICLNMFQKYGVSLPDHHTWQRLDHIDKHRELLESVDLREVRSQTKQVGHYLKGEQECWDLVFYTGFRSFLNQLSQEDQSRYKEEYLKEI
ncbi:MAG: methyltransferase domain-containing protein, partial [Candidatus Omnitrophica bacterium]|nr:methyltransferase domain-containing protein [Candidatus Omnitrophota bacterium]